MIKLTLTMHHSWSVESDHSNSTKEHNQADHKSESELECVEEPLSMNPHVAKTDLEDDHSQEHSIRSGNGCYTKEEDSHEGAFRCDILDFDTAYALRHNI